MSPILQTDFDINILAFDDPPTLSFIQDRQFLEDGDGINITLQATDPDNETITFNVDYTDSEGYLVDSQGNSTMYKTKMVLKT